MMVPERERGIMRVLLVEDDGAIVRTLSELLADEGFSVITEATQDGACARLAAESFDIALLDVTLAQGNGFAVCAAAREVAPDMPVIFLTASDDEYSTVAGLDMGAVDYIAKPFRARELVSRMRGALRRTSPADNVLTMGDVRLNVTSGAVTRGGTEVFLSALEYRLLLYFLQHKGKLVTREMLRDAIWDSAGEYVSDNALNVYIKRLREKVEADPSDPQIIVTVRGLGYKVGA
jgi:DNA-binding response OmpR family regulator